MTSQYIGQSQRHSGDINLVAALMSIGIPLDTTDPVTVLDNAKGHYGTFHFLEYSDDGSTDVETLLEYWNGKRPIPDGHGFGYVCAFIRARPRGVQASDDLLDFAIDYLRERGHQMPGLRRLSDVPAFVQALPQGEAAYVLAYVWNRDLCYQLYRSASRKVYYEEGSGVDTRRALLDTRLPKWQAKELLSRLQG